MGWVGATSAIVVVILDLDHFERSGVDLGLEAAALAVDAVDFVATVVDLDAPQRPTPVRGHGANGLAHLPSGDRDVAVVAGLDGCRGHESQGDGRQDGGLHGLFLSGSKR